MKQDIQDSIAPSSTFTRTAMTYLEAKRNKKDILSAVDKALIAVWNHLFRPKAADNKDSTVLSEDCFADHGGYEFVACRSEEHKAEMVSRIGALNGASVSTKYLDKFGIVNLLLL